jgi:hypothetical protein
VDAFAASGYQCPQFKNPSDYFMRIVSDAGSHATLLAAQETRWASTHRAALAPARSGPMQAAHAGDDESLGSNKVMGAALQVVTVDSPAVRSHTGPTDEVRT